MEDVLLIVCVSAAMMFGFFLVYKVDNFLDANVRPSENKQEVKPVNSLQIVFSDPSVASSLSYAFTWFSENHPGVELCLFSSEENELLQCLCEGKADIAFSFSSLAADNNISYESVSVRIPRGSVSAGRDETAVLPISNQPSVLNIIRERHNCCELSEEFFRFVTYNYC